MGRRIREGPLRIMCVKMFSVLCLFVCVSVCLFQCLFCLLCLLEDISFPLPLSHSTNFFDYEMSWKG